MAPKLILCLIQALCLLLCIHAQINKEVNRVIDATNPSVKITADIKAEDVDKEYKIAFPSSQAEHLAFLSVKHNKKELKISAPVQQSPNVTVFVVHVNDPKPNFKMEAVFTSTLEMYPKEIAQSENQFVRLHDSHYFLSPYMTESQKTVIKLASASVESYTKRVPHSLQRDKITFGTYKDVKPFEFSPAVVHFLHNKPFAKFSTLSREVEVSHWGNIAFEEVYELKHAGAKLQGGFSRFDYQNRRMQNTPSFRNLVASLPKSAHNIYYRDQIGNISTSDIRVVERDLELDIQTRFPLFGGWQTQFYIGYSIPTEDALFVDENGRFNLKIDFFTIFHDVWVEDMEIKVILPEGCYDVKVDVPYPVEQSWSKRYTYLDSEMNGGRPVLTLKTKNLVEEHADKQVKISYSFNRPRLLVEPLILVATYFFLFVIAALVSRMSNLSSSKADKSVN